MIMIFKISIISSILLCLLVFEICVEEGVLECLVHTALDFENSNLSHGYSPPPPLLCGNI
ncbi:hypothetical protein Phum_PHUM418090 [Pediculus humanus corporis]|uniref:Uncharacterized protein n=1 Tax=Pediculus humanus subsp. corporis TaxID=121224 RepID=E0VSG5_PEDHC|nr:uncharacterized protein Phum_PHUM418090 [Pediculus humanus corporis]EEB16321.1 hypothetical protein Phum_PHUM418090 [Pediculus humanus corporis]